MTRSELWSIALLTVVVVASVSAQNAAKGVGTPAPEAAAYHAAAELYGRLSLFFGRQALRAEAAYWEVVK